VPGVAGLVRRWRAEYGVWVGVVGAVVAASPLVVHRLLGQAVAPSPWAWLVGVVLLTVAPLGSMATTGRGATAHGSRAWLFVPPAAWLLGSALAVAILESGTAYLTLPDLGDVPTFAALLVLADTLRRPALDERAFASRATAGALALFLGPALASAYGGSFSWACFSPIVSAEFAAWPVAEILPHVAAAHLALAVGLFVALFRRGPGRRTTTMGAMVGLALGSVVVDLATAAAVRDTLGALDVRPLRELDLATWSEFADLGGGMGLAVTLVIWVPSLVEVWARRSRRSRLTWVALAPAAPLLLLATSAAFEPRVSARFPQQTPEAVWNDEPGFVPLARPGRDGEIPFFMTRVEDTFSALVAPRHSVFFEGGRAAAVRWPATLAHPPRSFWGDWVEILPDARARLSDLPLTSVRHFAAIRLAWRIHPVDRSRARSRWAFAEMASRALRARTFALAQVPEQCLARREVLIEGARFVPCSLPSEAVRVVRYADTAEVDVLVVVEGDEWRISEWLDAIESIETPIVFAVDRNARRAERYLRPNRPTRPPDEVELRARSREPQVAWLGGLGTGAAFALLLLALGRRPRRWAARFSILLGGERHASVSPRGGPYRLPNPEPGSPIDAFRNLFGGLREASLGATDALRRWSLVVTIAALVGILLARLASH
jgi:hypothetical protein